MNKLFLILCTTFFMLYALTTSAAITKVDGIIAIVGSQPILESELITRFNIVKDRVPGGVMTTDIRRQILNQMIDESLQVNNAKRLGIRVSNQELENAILNVAAGLNTDLNGLKIALEKQGINYPKYRSQIENEILTSKLKGQIIRQRISISDAEINDFLNSDEALAANKDQVRLRHIIIRNNKTSNVKNTISEIKDTIKNEQDFIDQAAAKSDGPTALKGGDIGWKPFNQLPSLFIKALNTGKGPLFGPIESSAGQHLLWLVDKKVPDGNFQEQTKVRHILLAENAIRNSTQTKAMIDSIYKQLQKGEDFAQLAIEFSDDKGSALKGGDLNWVTLGRMVPEFEKVMMTTKVGNISKPFTSQFGWHILLVEGRRSTDISEKVQRSNAEQALMAQKQDDVLSQWLDELRAQAFIDIK